ncbi:unnamed protein product, partial [Prorocentrum cordatum]
MSLQRKSLSDADGTRNFAGGHVVVISLVTRKSCGGERAWISLSVLAYGSGEMPWFYNSSFVAVHECAAEAMGGSAPGWPATGQIEECEGHSPEGQAEVIHFGHGALGQEGAPAILMAAKLTCSIPGEAERDRAPPLFFDISGIAGSGPKAGWEVRPRGWLKLPSRLRIPSLAAASDGATGERGGGVCRGQQGLQGEEFEPPRLFSEPSRIRVLR